MRASAQWQRRFGARFAPEGAKYGVVHLPSYSAEYVVVGEGPPVVMVPGLAGGFELLGRLAGSLARNRQVISFQLRGERDAQARRRGFNRADLVGDLGHFLDALGLERPTLLGVSFGGLIALEFAIHHPGRLSSLIVQGVDCRYRSRLFSMILKEALLHYRLPHDSTFINQFFKLLFGRDEEPGPLFDFVTSRCWQTDQGVMAHRLLMIEDFDVEDRLWRIRVPTLVMAAEHDVIVPWESQQRVALSIPGARFARIARGGHLCFFTEPRTVSAHVRRFLTQQEPHAD